MNTDRPQRGNLMYSLPDDYVVIDTETTGLDPRWDELIELAAVRVRNGQAVETYETLVRPQYPVSAFIAVFTGITNEMLADAPGIQDVIADYITFLGDDLLLGHNVNFDVNFIYDDAVRYLAKPMGNSYVDTMRMARRIFPKWKHHRLSDLKTNLKVQGDVAHRALSDAYDTKSCYDALRAVMAARGLTIDDIIPGKSLAAQAILPQTDAFDISSPFFARTFVFTGTMERMVRREAMQVVVDRGGYTGDKVTMDTNYLVMGNAGYHVTLSDGKSEKRKRAEQLKQEGQDIEIISEDVFLEMMD